MSETAIHPVEAVLPVAPVRQWVSSFSWTLRYLMGYDNRLASDAFEAVAQTVRERISRRVKRDCTLKSVMDVETGAVMFAQRFDSAHLLVLDSDYHWLPLARRQVGVPQTG